MLLLDEMYNNPVASTFVQLVRSMATEDRRMLSPPGTGSGASASSEAAASSSGGVVSRVKRWVVGACKTWGSDTVKDIELSGLKGSSVQASVAEHQFWRSRRAATRWFLAYTLLHNLQLRELRSHAIYAAQARKRNERSLVNFAMQL